MKTIHYTTHVTFSEDWTPCGLVLMRHLKETTCDVESVTCPECVAYLKRKVKKVYGKAKVLHKEYGEPPTDIVLKKPTEKYPFIHYTRKKVIGVTYETPFGAYETGCGVIVPLHFESGFSDVEGVTCVACAEYLYDTIFT